MSEAGLRNQIKNMLQRVVNADHLGPSMNPSSGGRLRKAAKKVPKGGCAYNDGSCDGSCNCPSCPKMGKGMAGGRKRVGKGVSGGRKRMVKKSAGTLLQGSGRKRKAAGLSGGRKRKAAGLVGGRKKRAGGLVGGKKLNPWLSHVAEVRNMYPELSYKEALMEAKNSY